MDEPQYDASKSVQDDWLIGSPKIDEEGLRKAIHETKALLEEDPEVSLHVSTDNDNRFLLIADDKPIGMVLYANVRDRTYIGWSPENARVGGMWDRLVIVYYENEKIDPRHAKWVEAYPYVCLDMRKGRIVPYSGSE